MTPSATRANVTVFWAFVAALGNRFAVAFLSPVINSDGPLYLTQAEALLRGEFARTLLHHNYAPVTSALISLALYVGLPPEAAGRLVCSLTGALAVFPLHALARRAFSALVAAAAVFLYAFAPVPAHLSASVLTTGPFVFVSLLAVALLAQLREAPRPRTALLAGTAVAIAWATRADGLILLPLACATGLAARRGGWAARFGFALLALAPCAVAVAAYASFGAGQETGPLTRKLDSVQWARFLDPDLPTPYVVGLLWEDLGEALFLPLVPFLVVGLLVRPREGDRVVRCACLALVVAWIVVLSQYAMTTGAMSKRHTTPLAVAMLPWVAAGLLASARWVAGRIAAGDRAKAWACAVTVLVACGACVPKLLKQGGGARMAEKAAGLWLRDHADRRAPVLCGGTRVPFYAGLPQAPTSLARHPPNRAFGELRRRGIEYIVKDRGLEAFAPEFVRELRPPRVTPMGRIQVDGSEKVIEVFRLPQRVRRRASDAQANSRNGR